MRAHDFLTDDRWTGGDQRLWFLGDYVDRGREGLGVVDLVRQLQDEARHAGGEVNALLGNHELQFLAALHFGDRGRTGDRPSWGAMWRRYGGVESELEAVDEEQVHWMTHRPLMDTDAGLLFLHSDTEAYLQLGRSVQEINAAGHEILRGRDPDEWELLHELMTRRGDFLHRERVDRMLGTLGVTRMVHGHSTLGGVFGLDRSASTRPHVYADGRVTAIDGGVFEGGAIVVANL